MIGKVQDCFEGYKMGLRAAVGFHRTGYFLEFVEDTKLMRGATTLGNFFTGN